MAFYGNIVEYIKYLQSFKRASIIRPGYFYVYEYDFMTHYPIEELKFYDYMPLSFVFTIINGKDRRYFQGLNFHHMPVKARQWWLAKVKTMARTYFDRGGFRRIPGLDYAALSKIMRKGKFGVRNYRFESVRNLREVPLNDLDEVLKFYAKTYYAVTIGQIQVRYNSFRP